MTTRPGTAHRSARRAKEARLTNDATSSGDAPKPRRGLFQRPHGPRALGRDQTPTTFIDLRDDGVHAFRQGAFATAADYLTRAHALKPDATVVTRTLAETLFKLGRAREAYDFASEALANREDPRIRRTRAVAARTLLRQALIDGARESFFELLTATRDDIVGGAQGAPFRLLAGAVSQDRVETQSALTQLTSRARYQAAVETRARVGSDQDDEATPPDPAVVARRLGRLYGRIALDGRRLFSVDPEGACFLLDVAIAGAPDEPRMRAERLWFGLARGELDNPHPMLDYALDRRVWGLRLDELDRAYRFTLTFRAPDATTRALRALRLRQLDVLADKTARSDELEAAGRIALAFGDFEDARIALEALTERAEAAGEQFDDAPPIDDDADYDGGPPALDGTPPPTEDARPDLAPLDAATRLARAATEATRVCGDLAPDFTAAAQTFWREILDAREPLAAFFESLSEELISVTVPPGLLIAPDDRDGLRTQRHTLFAALRVFARRGAAHELRLFPWSVHELERTPRGAPMLAHGSRRGPRANRFLTHGPGPLPSFVYIDRFGVDGWSEIAQSLPFAEARSSEISAYLETLRLDLFGADAPALLIEPAETIAVLLQKPSDPELELARISMRDMMRESVAWAERRDRRAVIWRPRDCAHLGVSEALSELAKSDRLDIRPAPEGPAALGLALADKAGLVTVNAPASIASLLAYRPLLLCGGSDLHHGARNLDRADAIGAALDVIDAPIDPTTVARFIFDYLTGPMAHLLSPANVEERLIARMEEAGVPHSPR